MHNRTLLALAIFSLLGLYGRTVIAAPGDAIYRWSANPFGCIGAQTLEGTVAGVCTGLTSLTSQAWSTCGYPGSATSYTFNEPPDPPPATWACNSPEGDAGITLLSTNGECSVEGEYLNEVTGLCDPDGPPPGGEECPEGTSYMNWGNPLEENAQCTMNLPPFEEQDSCATVLGRWDGNKIICQEDFNDCSNVGTFGIGDGPGSGSAENPQPICVPPALPLTPQLCQTGEVLRYNHLTGDEWCSPYTPSDPEEWEDDPPDLDGDGIPDSQDPDIDGDGVDNENDDDRDGDGVTNANDIDPDGQEEGEEGSVSGGGTCDSKPVCEGDAVQCAILYQNWAQRCEVDLPAETGFGTEGGLYEPLEYGISEVFTEFGERLDASDLVNATDTFFTISLGGACPIWSVNAWEFTVTIDQFCSGEIPWTLIRGIIIAVASLIAMRIALT